MHFIHKQDHIPLSADLAEQIPESFLKLTPILGARHQIGHIQTHQPFVPQRLRHVSHGHPLGKSLCNSRLTNTGFPHQSRVILLLSAKDTDDHIDLLFSADHRLHCCRFDHQVFT